MRIVYGFFFLILYPAAGLWAQKNAVPVPVADNADRLAYTPPSGYKEGTDYLPARVVFKLKEGHENALRENGALAAYLREIGAEVSAMFPQAKAPQGKTDAYGRAYVDLTRIYEIGYTATLPVREVMDRLKRLGGMEYVQPRLIVHPFAEDRLTFTPNDPNLPQQWHLTKINAPQAWDITTGNPSVRVAILDGGTNFSNPDLLNIAYNTADPVDGIDNDGDGWIDNYRGWNTGDNNNNPQYNVNHGVAVTGLSSATTNNGTDVAGVGYQCPYVPVRISNTAGSYVGGETGIFYAARQGIKIINCSWGGTSPWPLLEDVTRYAAINEGCLLVSSAGNANNSAPYWPAAYEWVTCVAGTNSADLKSTGSSGSSYYEWVDLSAPGEAIYTTSNASSQNVGTGTSWSAPQVSGAAALVKSRFPAYSAEQIKALLKETSFDLYTLPGNAPFAGMLGRGRLDVGAALTTVPGPSVEMTLRRWADGNDNLFMPGETVSLSGLFVNWLNPSSAALRCTLRSQSPYATLIDSVVSIGVLANPATFDNAASPFRFSIAAGCPANTVLPFKLIFRDGAYTDKQFFSLAVAPDYVNITENRVHTSVGSIGRIGFMDEASTHGLGLSKNGMLQHLVASSFMLANSPTRVSDAGVGPTVNPFTNDFRPVSPAVPVIPPVVSDFDARGAFDDANAGAARLNVLTRYKAWAWNDPARENFVILEYTLRNTGGSTLSNLFAGIFSYWEIPNGQYYMNSFIADWDGTRKLGYGYNGQTPVGSYAGVKLLSGDPVSWYAINNNGAGGSISLFDGFSEAEKYTTLSGGVSRPTAVPGTVSGVLGTGPFTLAAGDSVTVAFALLLGDNLTQLQTAADSAQQTYNLLHATWTGTLSSDWNQPGNWQPNRVPNACQTDVYIPVTPNIPTISDADYTVGNLFLADGTELRIQNAHTLNVCKNIQADTDAVITGGHVRLMGDKVQHVSGRLRASYFRLDNALGAEIDSLSALSLLSGLELPNGIFRSRSNLTLLSSAAGTAYVDDFSTGYSGALAGIIHVQRYNPVGLAGFRQLGTPVNLPDISALGGFTPSGSPGFIIPVPTCDPNYVASNSPYGNWMRLVENAPVQYGCSQSLFEVLLSGGMTNGRGYYLDVPGNSTLTFRGTANTGPVSFGLTHANGSVSNGWNQVSNPYPSPLRWELTNVPAGVDAIGKIWVTSGTYMGTFQDLDPNLAGIQSVAIGQAFQVRVSTPGSTPAFAVDNTDRSIDPPTYLFAGGADSLSLFIDVLSGGFADLCKIRFISDAGEGMDARYDSPKLMGKSNQPMIYSLWNGARYSTNSLPDINRARVIPLAVKAAQSGSYSLVFSNMESFPASAFIYLEDVETGIWRDIRVNDTYTVDLGAGEHESRFMLHFYPPLEPAVSAGNCTENGHLLLTDPSPATWHAALYDAQHVLRTQTDWTDELRIDSLEPGTYTLQLTEQTSGYALSEAILISGVQAVSAQAQSSLTQATAGEEIAFTAQVQHADSYRWDFGDLQGSSDLNPLHAYTAPGTYEVRFDASNADCQTEVHWEINVGSALSINNPGSADVKIWNADENIYLEFAEAWTENARFTLYDALGRQLLQRNVPAGTWHLVIDASGLSAGMYTVELRSARQRVSRKMMKGIH